LYSLSVVGFWTDVRETLGPKPQGNTHIRFQRIESIKASANSIRLNAISASRKQRSQNTGTIIAAHMPSFHEPRRQPAG